MIRNLDVTLPRGLRLPGVVKQAGKELQLLEGIALRIPAALCHLDEVTDQRVVRPPSGGLRRTASRGITKGRRFPPPGGPQRRHRGVGPGKGSNGLARRSCRRGG